MVQIIQTRNGRVLFEESGYFWCRFPSVFEYRCLPIVIVDIKNFTKNWVLKDILFFSSKLCIYLDIVSAYFGIDIAYLQAFLPHIIWYLLIALHYSQFKVKDSSTWEEFTRCGNRDVILQGLAGQLWGWGRGGGRVLFPHHVIIRSLPH